MSNEIYKESMRKLCLVWCGACTEAMYRLLEKSCVSVYCRERSKGPLLTSLQGIGTSGGPAAPLVNMLFLSGPRRHTIQVPCALKCTY